MELVGWNMGIYPPTHVRHVVWFARHLSPSKRGVIFSRRGLILSRQGLVVTNIGLEFQFQGVHRWEYNHGLCLQRLALTARQLRA